MDLILQTVKWQPTLVQISNIRVFLDHYKQCLTKKINISPPKYGDVTL